MNNLNLIKYIADIYNIYANGIRKNYTNTKHVMTKDSEILVSSDKEEYVFVLDGWTITEQDNNIITIVKK